MLLRESGLLLCLLNPDDLETEEKLHDAVWKWVEKILDSIDSPHFLFVVSKIDEIEDEEKEVKLNEMRNTLQVFLGRPKAIKLASSSS